MDHLEGRLAELGSTGLHLLVDPRNEGALQFYRRLGFSEQRPPDLPVGAVAMVKRLSPPARL
jgi:ribosomal protein S18 acetylase RimI-like enzyme